MIDLLDRVSTGRDHGITETALMDDLEACSRANDILELWISGRIRHLSVVSEACHRPGADAAGHLVPPGGGGASRAEPKLQGFGQNYRKPYSSWRHKSQ